MIVHLSRRAKSDFQVPREIEFRRLSRAFRNVRRDRIDRAQQLRSHARCGAEVGMVRDAMNDDCKSVRLLPGD